ncbi:hypothetical protein RintRC_7765 [Richelia intracellularis]|nr:hypothetical protein RintRC_7765 [Richelia intracellularis]
MGITCAPGASTIDSTQRRKHRSNTFGLMGYKRPSKCI